MKLTVKENKIDLFVSQEPCYCSTGLILNFAFGPEKLLELTRNGLQHRTINKLINAFSLTLYEFPADFSQIFPRRRQGSKYLN